MESSRSGLFCSLEINLVAHHWTFSSRRISFIDEDARAVNSKLVRSGHGRDAIMFFSDVDCSGGRMDK